MGGVVRAIFGDGGKKARRAAEAQARAAQARQIAMAAREAQMADKVATGAGRRRPGRSALSYLGGPPQKLGG